MSQAQDLIDEARDVIDGECNCHTAEYRALDLLCRAVDLMLIDVEQNRRTAMRAANAASSLANGEKLD